MPWLKVRSPTCYSGPLFTSARCSMNDTFSPRACAPDQWKVWLRDGVRLYLRGLSSWGALWIVLYLALGWSSQSSTVLSWCLIGLSGVFQHMHTVAFEQLRSGEVGWMDVLRAQRALVAEHTRLLVRSMMVRLVAGLVLILLAAAITVGLQAWIASHASSVPSSTTQGWWDMLTRAGLGAALVAGLPVWIQSGGPVSFVLGLLRHRPELSSTMARHLDVQAHQLNLNSLYRLHLAWAAVWVGVLLTFPFLTPIALLLWLSVLSCAYADIFEGGYSIEAMAPMRVPSLRARTVRAAVQTH